MCLPFRFFMIHGGTHRNLDGRQAELARFMASESSDDRNGAWSRGSSAWRHHAHVAGDICQRGGCRLDRGQQDGSFWMLFEDFSSCFDSVAKLGLGTTVFPSDSSTRLVVRKLMFCFCSHHHVSSSPQCIKADTAHSPKVAVSR